MDSWLDVGLRTELQDPLDLFRARQLLRSVRILEQLFDLPLRPSPRLEVGCHPSSFTFRCSPRNLVVLALFFVVSILAVF
jgi:hypothetical protein